MNKLASTLHDATHQVPGVPAHDNNPLPHQHKGHPHLQSRRQLPLRQQKPPRILIAWQNWIAQRFGQSIDR